MPIRASARRLVIVKNGNLPNSTRKGHWQLAAPITSPNKTSAIARRPLHRAAMLPKWRKHFPPSTESPAGDHSRARQLWVFRPRQRLTPSSCWTPGKSRSARSRASPEVQPDASPDLSPTTITTTSASCATRTASSNPERSASLTAQPPAYNTREVGSGARVHVENCRRTHRPSINPFGCSSRLSNSPLGVSAQSNFPCPRGRIIGKQIPRRSALGPMSAIVLMDPDSGSTPLSFFNSTMLAVAMVRTSLRCSGVSISR